MGGAVEGALEREVGVEIRGAVLLRGPFGAHRPHVLPEDDTGGDGRGGSFAGEFLPAKAPALRRNRRAVSRRELP